MVSTKSHENNPASDKFSSIEWLTNQAIKKHKEGKAEEAIAFYLEVIELDEDRPAWMYGNAITLLSKLSWLNSGLKLSQKALTKYPESDLVFVAIGILNRQRGDLEASTKSYREAVGLNSNQPDWVYTHLIDGLVEQNLVDDALEIGKLGKNTDLQSHWLEHSLGNAFLKKEMWLEAKKSYLQALTIEPDFKEARERLNFINEQLTEDFDNAIENSLMKSVDPTNKKPPLANNTSSNNYFAVEVIAVGLGGQVECKFVTRREVQKQTKLRVLTNGKQVSTIKLNRKQSQQSQNFSFYVPVSLLNEREHKFEFFWLEYKQSVETVIKIPRRSVGRIEDCKNNYIRGWVLPEGHFEGSANIDIYIDDIFFTEAKANLERQDLLKHGFGNGKNGFKVFLPLPPKPEKSYKVDVCFSGTKTRLKKSPLVFTNSTKPVSQPLFQAKITDLEIGGLVKGWAIDRAKPSQDLKIKVLVDGNSISVVKASKSCSEIDPFGQTPKEFQFHLPFTLLDDRNHRFELILLNQKQSIVQSVVTNIVVPKLNIGRIDGWHNNCITGWAVPEGHRGKPTFLDVCIDGTFYQEIRADKPRKDLLKYNLGNGRNGFEVAMPIPPGNKSKYRVDIFYKGTSQKLQKSPIEIEYSASQISTDFQAKFAAVHNAKNDLQHQTITIVIPVFNAYEELKQCLKSVFKYTSLQAKLVLIDDCSTDERISGLLDWAATYTNVTVLNNQPNLGYTRTINKGINSAPDDDIVLLNSDAEVGPYWLQNLRNAVYHQADIATATAVSDNSGAFSVPIVGCANQFPIWLDKEETIRAVSQNSRAIYPETPTGSGFCIYIRREVFDEIGVFDEAAFPRGYGEENDFCMRAIRAGWRNIVDNRTLVYHVRSASFREEKTLLYDAGRNIVDERYPDYRGRVRVFVHSPQMNVMRYGIGRLIEGNWSSSIRPPRPRILFVISTQTGGTPQTNRDLMSGLQNHYHTMVLRCDATQIILYDTSNEVETICASYQLQSPITLTAHQSLEYEKIVGEILVNYGIEILHVRHIAWHSLSLCRVAKKLGLTVLFSFHDFYAVCPTVNLLDENRTFCSGHCTKTDGDCSVPLWKEHNHVPRLKNSFIKAWREMIAGIFPHVDAFVTTSNSTKTLIEDIYPQLKQQVFEVIPHGRDFPQLNQESYALAVNHPSDSKPLRILFPGNIHSAKGAELITEIKALDREGRLEFHFLGTATNDLKSIGVYHGSYQRQDFTRLVSEIQPNYIGIFSIWPETYCHTLTESWASGIPVIAIDLGAVRERIERHGGGWLIAPDLNSQEVYRKLLQIASDPEGHTDKVSAVNRWQLSYGRQNRIATMAQKYHRLYQRIKTSLLPFRENNASKQANSIINLGVFIHRSVDRKSPPSAHIRVLEWLKCNPVSQNIYFQPVDVDSFIHDRSNVFELDMVLVQRNTIKPHLVDRFISHCKEHNLPIIFEIDDDLTNVPVEKDPAGIYAKTAVGIKAIVKAASTVIVSTKPLAEKLSQYNSNIVTIPNTISEHVWFKPLSTKKSQPDQRSDRNIAKILYMGNPTHAEDIAMIRPVFENLADSNYSIQLYVIGGEPNVKNTQSSWYERIDIPSECRHYPKFVSWFRNVASTFDLAIAPLVESEFNQCKSSLKYLQYSAVELPTICSNVTPYKELVNSEVNGFLVENTVEQWHKAILNALKQTETLKNIASNAKKFVVEQYGMSYYINTYTDIFRQLYQSKGIEGE